MGFNIYTSNSIEKLSALFCKSIKEKASWQMATPIVVQTEGIQKWLTQEVAAQNKIFANFNFFSPNDFVRQIFQMAGIYSSHFFTKENLRWILFKLLNDNEFKAMFKTISAYYESDATKQFQLAAKVADLFDQYMVYRTDYIEAWSNNREVLVDMNSVDGEFKRHEEWQKWLWLKLKTISNDELDKLDQKRALLEKLNNSDLQESIKGKYPKLSLFGISVISDYYLQIFEKIASFIDVDLYLLTPTALKKSGDASSIANPNELLASCNQLSLNILSLLEGCKCQWYDHTITPTANNLLTTIQLDLFSNSNSAIEAFNTNQTDTSLQIVSSYTPLREVEALYNYLLNELESDTSLKLSDISVQLTDVALYAPFVEAVFNNAPKKIPYIITDVAVTSGDSLIHVLESLLALPSVNFKAENVMQLLANKAIQDRFEITDLDGLRAIIANANIRFGIDGSKEDDTYLFSWNYGLTKLLLGYAIKGETKYILNDVEYYPADMVEGAEAINILKLKAFTNELFQLCQAFNSDRTMADWRDFILHDFVENLFLLNDTHTEELDYLYQKLENMVEMAPDGDEKIPFILIQQALSTLFSSDTKKSNYISGALTFSSILSVRSMPFKHIAILGVNATTFPRKQTNLGFDLIALNPRTTDRNIKDNDKYLFLEAILAARKQLYLSYIGSNISDNSHLPPSLLIEELQDYLITGTKSSSWYYQNIHLTHPLHISNSSYFTNKRLFTYLGSNQYNVEPLALIMSPATQPDFDFNEIALHDLITFYRDPFKWYYHKILQIYYTADEDLLLLDEEPFALDKIQQYGLKIALLTLPESDEPDYIKKVKSLGQMPLANMALAELKIQKEAVAGVREQIENLITGEATPYAKQITLGNSILKGKIDTIYADRSIQVNVSGKMSQPKYIAEAWIKHLFLIASGLKIETHFVSPDNKFSIHKDAVTVEKAKDTLQQLISIYQKGHTHIIPFMPNEGWLLIENIDSKNKDEATAIDISLREFKSKEWKDYRSAYVIKEEELGLIDMLLSKSLSESDRLYADELRAAFLQVSKLLFYDVSLMAKI